MTEDIVEEALAWQRRFQRKGLIATAWSFAVTLPIGLLIEVMF